MKALRRVLLTFWGLLCIAAAALMAVMLVNTGTANAVINFLDKYFMYNMEQTFLHETGIWVTLLIGLFLLAFGLFCVVIALLPKPSIKKLRIATVDGGAVDIGLVALHNMVKRAASNQEGISSIEPRLAVKNNGLHIDLQLIIDEGHPVPDLGQAVSEEVKSQLEAMAGIIPAEVKVVVTNILEQKEEKRGNGN
jgi:hypothetical protein